MAQDTQIDFLYSFIEDQLNTLGFDDVDDATKTAYTNRFLTELHRRLGVAVMPHLDKESTKELTILMESSATTPTSLDIFWKKHVKDFDTIVSGVLDAFAQEMKHTFENIRA